MSWNVYGGENADVVPVDDLIGHDLNDDCWCGPTITPVERDDGAIVYMRTHHAADGREHHEHDHHDHDPDCPACRYDRA